MNVRPNTFEVLPNEMLYEITSYLPYDCSLANLSQTSKRWNNIVAQTDGRQLAIKLQKLKKLQPSHLSAYFATFVNDGYFAPSVTITAIVFAGVMGVVGTAVGTAASASLADRVLDQLSIYSTKQKQYAAQLEQQRTTFSNN